MALSNNLLGFSQDSLLTDSKWYKSKKANRIAQQILLYQHDNGGWYKNIDMKSELSPKERLKIIEEKSKNYGTTIDNGATYSQLTFLAKTYKATNDVSFKIGFIKGFDYLIEAQYANGGWPQFYPLKEGYYSHITFNDDAMIGVMRLLKKVADGHPNFDFLDRHRKEQAKRAIEKGVDLILKTQVKIDGQLTVWCAQYNEHTLKPAQARAYELISLSGKESVEIVRFLMNVERPTKDIIHAVESAVIWFKNHQITGKELKFIWDDQLPNGKDRILVDDPDAPPLWARFYHIENQRPIYVGRDGIIKYKLSEIEQERRGGYSYVDHYALELLAETYPKWKQNLKNL